LAQFWLAALVIVAELPTLMTVALDPNRDTARAILFDVVMPFHYSPAVFIPEIIEFIGWQVLAIVSIGGLARSGPSRNVIAIYVALLSLVVSTVVLSAIFRYSPFTQLFAWRLAPFVNFLACIMIALSAAKFLVNGHSGRRLSARSWQVLIVLFGGVCVIAASAAYRPAFSPRSIMQAASVGFLGLVLLAQGAQTGPSRVTMWQRPGAVTAGLVCVLFLTVLGAALSGHHRTARFSLIFPVPVASEDQVFEWARSTATDSLFLVPPSLTSFRLFGERAVIVDWKANPILPGEVVEWHGRLETISGRSGFRTLRELDDGYGGMSPKRLDHIIGAIQSGFCYFSRAFRRT
jgi:hypothetical protein